MEKLDYKKAYKDLYMPKTQPARIMVPPMTFITVSGQGNPNEPDGEYQAAVALLYALSWTIKMSPKSGTALPGYFDYVVPPLEGLWWLNDGNAFNPRHKDRFQWISMIRQPEFVDAASFSWAQEQVARKKALDPSPAELQVWEEGLCVQCMHLGPYDDEPATLALLEAFIAEQNLLSDLSIDRPHHEIYLGDPRKTDPAKLKTVLRLPVKEK